ncbi:unnamed protein product [Parajaminaea phylloscopi]
MTERKPNRHSIVASMGLEPRMAPAEPLSPPVWGPPPASPTASPRRKPRNRMDSTASRTSVATSRRRSVIKPGEDAGGEGDKVRAAGSATARYRPPRPPTTPPAQPEREDPRVGGSLGRSFTSKLFGRNTSTPPPAASNQVVPGESEPSSYAQRDAADVPPARKALLSGLTIKSKDRAEPTPASDGDMRRTRWNARKTSSSVVTMGMADLDLDDDDDATEMASQAPDVVPRGNALGLGRLSSDNQTRKRPFDAHRGQSARSVTRHQLIDEGPVAAPIKRSPSAASGKTRSVRESSAPQLPALTGFGLGRLGSIVRDSRDVEPGYEDDNEPTDRETDSDLDNLFPARPTGRITEEEEDEEDFQEADDSAFPVTPGLSERGAFTGPVDHGEPADVVDDDDVAPVLQPSHSIATVGPIIDSAAEDAPEEQVPAYDEATSRDVVAEKGHGVRAGKSIAVATTGGILAAGAVAAHDSSSRPVVPEAGQGTSPPPQGVYLASTQGTHDDGPEANGGSETHETVNGSAVPLTAAAVVPARKKTSKSKQSGSPTKDSQPVLMAAPPLIRTTSPPPPEKPRKSQARKLTGSRTQAVAVPAAQRDLDDTADRRKSKSRNALAAGTGALAIGGATAAAARHKDHEDDVASGPDADYDNVASSSVDGLSDEEYRTTRKTTKSSRKAAPAADQPSKRSQAVRNLTPVQRHYLLKALVNLQMQQEWEELEKLGALTQYGFPFTPEPPKLTRVKADLKNEYTGGDDVEEEADDPYAGQGGDMRRLENLQQPLILRHLFHVHIRTFPGLDAAPLKFWQQRIQVFFDEMAARNFSTSVERAEYSKRRFYTLVATRYLGGYFARGIGVRGQGELRGPGPGEKGSERWGVGKQWGKGTVKRGLDRPARINTALWKKIDGLFGDGPEGQLWRRAGKETTRVRGDWHAWKEQIIENEIGLEETINFLDIQSVRNLPAKYRNAEEWARNHAAYLLHALFVTTPGADSTYKVVKGIHTLFPYWGAKQLLKYTNAQVLIEGILNLLLARPAGAKSLIQRIANYVISSEATALQKESLGPLKKAIKDSELTDRIDDYVGRGNRPEGRSVRAKAEKTGDDVLTVILLSAGGTPLRRSAQDAVVELQGSFARSPLRGAPEMAYPADSAFAKENPDKVQLPRWDAGRGEMDEAIKFARLKLYLRDSLKARDRVQAMKVASGALIPTIIKDVLQTVMYDVIKQIAKTADLSARLGDLQSFVEDLLEVKKRKDDSIEAWIALAARHEESLYFLVHECSPIAQRLFDWCQIGLDFMALSTTDPVHPADRKAKNIEVNLEELLQDSRLSEKDVELILEEVDELAVFTKWSKVAYELEMRKNFLLARSDAATSSKLTEDDVPIQMKEDVRDVDSLMRELMQSEGVPVDDGTLPNESRGTEAKDLPTLWFDVMDPLGQHLRAERGSASELVYTPQKVTPPVPCLKYIRKAMPMFREVLEERLPDWQHGDANGPKKKATPSSLGRSASTLAVEDRRARPSSKKSKGIFGR